MRAPGTKVLPMWYEVCGKSADPMSSSTQGRPMQRRTRWLGLGWLLHHALLRALRAPRLAHETPLDQRPLRAGALSAHRLNTSQGKQLAVWLVRPEVPGSAASPAVLVMHGWGANAAMMWPVVQPLVDTGHVVALLDARCHGESDGDDFTSLPRFAEDIATALHWLVQRIRPVNPS
jgi:uncharacterized protein